MKSVVLGVFVVLFTTGFTNTSQHVSEDNMEIESYSLYDNTDAALSDDARVACYEAGMTDQEILDDPGSCLSIFWTPERMENAVSIDSEGQVVDQQTGVTPWNLIGIPDQITETESSMNGKIFYTLDEDQIPEDEPFAQGKCSASAVSTPSGQMIATAAHCLHRGMFHDFYQDAVYVPMYSPYGPPFGQFIVQGAGVQQGWSVGSDSTDDYAFAYVEHENPYNTSKLIDVTGGHDISFDNDESFQATMIGYPSMYFDGLKMLQCRDTMEYNTPSSLLASSNCPMNHGASGGPILTDIDEVSHQGTIRGIMSEIVLADGTNEDDIKADDILELYSPVFDQRTEELFITVESLAMEHDVL